MRLLRARAFAFLVVAAILLAGLAQSAPSRVEVVARAPQAQRPDASSGDDDPSRPGTQVNPRAGGPRQFPTDIILDDENGHNDVRRVTVTVLKADNVTIHRQAVDAAKLSASGTRATWRATVTMASNDTPGTYILRAEAIDRDSAVSLAWTNFTYEPLAALALAQENVSLVPTGSAGFAPGAAETTPVAVNVTNGGNVPVNVTLAATALSNATHESSVPPSSLRAARWQNMSSPVALSTSAQTVPGLSIAANATAPLYFSMQVPAGLRPGVYVGELTVSAVAAP
ncbi:MAG TPA: hypothetical protein VFH78_10935 [Candidatus Thermoplasmatota archaeon]|nr:hypothetical protein [Candidatus Thermoplasmatota archaeon]